MVSPQSTTLLRLATFTVACAQLDAACVATSHLSILRFALLSSTVVEARLLVSKDFLVVDVNALVRLTELRVSQQRVLFAFPFLTRRFARAAYRLFFRHAPKDMLVWRHIGVSPDEAAEMVKVIGCDSLDQLIDETGAILGSRVGLELASPFALALMPWLWLLPWVWLWVGFGLTLS